MLARRHACERGKHGGKSRGPQGPGRRGQQAFLGTEGSTPHSTLPGSRAPDGLSPTRGRRSPGLGRALAHAHSLSPAPTPPHPLFPPQALRTVDVVGSFLPCRREKWQSGLCSHPCRDGPHSHQNVVALHFQTRPSIGPSLHSASWNSPFMHSLGQSKYKSEV